MVREMVLKYAVVYENVLHEFNFGHSGIKRKVNNIAHAKFNNLIFQITNRWLFIADSDRSYRYGGPIIFPFLFHIGICPIKHN